MHISNKCSVAIHCLVYIYEYGMTNKVTGELLSLSTGCNPVTIRSIVSALRKDGILKIRTGSGGARLSCSPEEITLYRICMAVEPQAIQQLMGIHPAPSMRCQVGQNIKLALCNTYEKLQRDVEESMKSITLRHFIDEFHSLVPEIQ